MAYIGNIPAESFISFEKQVFTIVNSQTAYTLSHSVVNENDIRLVVNSVVQEPGSGKAYTASGTTLTLSAALVNGTDTMYCVFLGRAIQTVNPPNASVGTAQLGSDAVTEAKIADDAVESEHLNNNVISGQTALGATPADTDELLISDAGTLKKVDYSYIKGEANSPYFRAYMGGTNTLNNNTTTKVPYDTTSWNVGGTYATGTFRWTPGVQGRYFIHAQVTINWSDGAGDRIDLLIRKNGTNINYRRIGSGGNFGVESSTVISATVDLDSDDYVEVFCEQDSGSNRTYSGTGQYNFWEGFLIATY